MVWWMYGPAQSIDRRGPTFKCPTIHTHSQNPKDPTLNEEDLVELGVPIRLHRRRLLALVADFGRHGVPPEALLLRPGAAVKEEAAAPGAGGGVKEAEHPPVPMADLVQQELWAAARLELLALEEREEQEGTG